MNRDPTTTFGHRNHLPVVVVLAWAVVSWPGKLAAMDCVQAKTASEKAICGEPALLGLDMTLNEAYAKLRGKLSRDERERLTMHQRIWVARRDRCGSRGDCLKKAMESRIAALAAGGDRAPPIEEQKGPFVIRYIRSPAWSIWKTVAPIIVKGPPGDGVKSIKQLLREEVDRLSEGCDEYVGEFGDLGFEYESRVVYADRQFFTLRDWHNVECGNMDNGYGYATYLVSSGERLDLSSAFKKELTAKTIIQLVQKHLKKLPAELKNRDPDCPKTYREQTDSYNVAVVPDGLLFMQDNAGSCEIEVTLPPELLAPFIAPEGPLGASAKHR